MPQRDKFSAPQGEPFHEQYLRSISEGILGGGVVERNDLEVSANSSNDGVNVEAGSLWYPPDTFSVGSQQSLSATTSPSDDRWDTVVYDTGTSSLSYNEGAAGTNPEPPMPTGDEFPLAFVYVPNGGGVQDSNVHNWRPAASRRKNIKTKTKTVSSDYTTSGERIIFVDTSGSAVTITLDSADRYDGAAITIADIQGNANNNNITIADGTGDNIAGSANQTIQTNYGSLTVKSDGSSWTTAGGGGGGSLVVKNGGSDVTDPTETIDFGSGVLAAAGPGTNEAAVVLDLSYPATWTSTHEFQSDIQLNDGTTGSPALQFENDTDTGLIRSAADALGLVVNGTEYVTLDTSSLSLSLPADLNSGAIQDGGTDAISLDGSANVSLPNGKLNLVDGSQSDPALQFSNDGDTGLVRPGADLLSLVTNGSDQMTIGTNAIGINGNDLNDGKTTIWDDTESYIPRAQQDLNHITTTVSSNTTTSDEEIIFVDSSAGTYTITLASVDADGGNQIAIIDDGGNASSNNITIDTESAETIEGLSSLTIADDYGSYLLESNGSNWRVIAQTPDAGATSLPDLSDVNVSSPSAGQSLLYHATNSQFENAGVTAGTGVSKSTGDASLTLSLDESVLEDGGSKELDVADLAGGLGTADQLPLTDGSAVSWGTASNAALTNDTITRTAGTGLTYSSGSAGTALGGTATIGIATDGVSSTEIASGAVGSTQLATDAAGGGAINLSDIAGDNITVDGNNDELDTPAWSTVAKSSNYTASNYENVLVDASSSAVTVTLPAVATDLMVTVKATDATNTVTIATPNAETIDGDSNRTIDADNVALTLTSDGSNYFIV